MTGFIYRTTRHCNILNIKAVGLMVSEKIFRYIYPFYNVCIETLYPQCGASLNSRDLTVRIYVEDY